MQVYKTEFDPNQKPDTKQDFQISKAVDDEQLVFGWASVAKNADGTTPLDWQGDTLEAADLEPAVYKFNLDFRDSNDCHKSNTDCGKLVESVIFTKEKMAAMGIPEGVVPEGWWVGFKIYNPEVYQKVKAGIYKMFSIEGSATRVKEAE